MFLEETAGALFFLSMDIFGTGTLFRVNVAVLEATETSTLLEILV